MVVLIWCVGAQPEGLKLTKREGKYHNEVRGKQGKILQGLMEFFLSTCWYVILRKFPNYSSVKRGTDPTRQGFSKDENLLCKKVALQKQNDYEGSVSDNSIYSLECDRLIGQEPRWAPLSLQKPFCAGAGGKCVLSPQPWP